MLKAFKYRIYPTKAQRSKMEQTLELCRWTYNETLAYRKNFFEQEGKSISKYETHNLLPEWKKNKPELKKVFSQTLQNVQERVDLAFKAFFRRVKAGEDPRVSQVQGERMVRFVHLSTAGIQTVFRQAASLQDRRYQDQAPPTHRRQDQEVNRSEIFDRKMVCLLLSGDRRSSEASLERWVDCRHRCGAGEFRYVVQRREDR